MVGKGDSAREALFQSCDNWLKANGVRESLSVPTSKVLAEDKHRHISHDDGPVRCDAHARAARAAG